MLLRFKLNHLFQGQNAPFLYAVDAGLYRREGLDVTFVEGFSSSQVTRALIAGEADFGFGDVTSVLELALRSGSVPVRALMPVYVRSPCSIGYRRRDPPLTLTDLEGAVLCGPEGDTSARLLPLLLARNGLEGLHYEMLVVSPEERDRLVARRAVLGATCFDATLKFAMAMRGHDNSDLEFLYYADHGLDTYSSALIARSDLLDATPDLSATLARIARQAWHDCMDDPQRGVGAVIIRNPSLDPAIARDQLCWVIDHQVRVPGRAEFRFETDTPLWCDTVALSASAASVAGPEDSYTAAIAACVIAGPSSTASGRTDSF